MMVSRRISLIVAVELFLCLSVFLHSSLLDESQWQCNGVFTPVTLNSATAPWQPRSNGAMWNSGNAIYVAGGTTGAGSSTPTTWRSADGGVTWQQGQSLTVSVTGNPGVAFNFTNFVFGGRSGTCADQSIMWTSDLTGTQVWTPTATPWGTRSFGLAVVWNPPPTAPMSPGIIFIGGTSCNVANFNDVWISTAWPPTVTTNWVNQGNGPFPHIISAGITTIQNASLVIIAGGFGDGTERNPFNNVWMGGWNVRVSAFSWWALPLPPWSPRQTALVSTANDYLYIVNGNDGRAFLNDVWVSADGAFTWQLLTAADAFSARVGAGLVSVGRELILMGGQNGTWLNDVWQAFVL